MPASATDRRQPFADRVLGETRDAVNAELAHDVLAVRADGLDADEEPRRDGLAGVAFCEQLDWVEETVSAKLVDFTLGQFAALSQSEPFFEQPAFAAA